MRKNLQSTPSSFKTSLPALASLWFWGWSLRGILTSNISREGSSTNSLGQVLNSSLRMGWWILLHQLLWLGAAHPQAWYWNDGQSSCNTGITEGSLVELTLLYSWNSWHSCREAASGPAHQKDEIMVSPKGLLFLLERVSSWNLHFPLGCR